MLPAQCQRTTERPPDKQPRRTLTTAPQRPRNFDTPEQVLDGKAERSALPGHARNNW
jgi:hypothetical protein